MKPTYDEIRHLIGKSEHVDFGTSENAPSDEWIARAEKRLGIPLSPSYKWWLKNYGGGEIGGAEIYSIYEMDFDTVSGGDIVYMAILNERDFGIKPSEKLFICEPNPEEAFYFLPGEADSEGEYPVRRYDRVNEVEEPYAEKFLEFLMKFIRDAPQIASR